MKFFTNLYVARKTEFFSGIGQLQTLSHFYYLSKIR